MSGPSVSPAPGNAPGVCRTALVEVWWETFERLLRCRRLDLGCLSSEERARARAFRQERHATGFTLSRALLRHVLGDRLDLHPAKVVFRYGPFGKPAVDAPILFNLSHCEGAVAIAVCRHAEEGAGLGIDVERLIAPDIASDLAPTCFSPAERMALARHVSPVGVSLAFTRGWTRKEAVLKALGGGLSLPLRSFDVALGESDGNALLASRLPLLSDSRCRLVDLGERKSVVAALALCGCEAIDAVFRTFDG